MESFKDEILKSTQEYYNERGGTALGVALTDTDYYSGFVNGAFQMQVKLSKQEDQPALSDFDRIRLETAATIAAGMYVRHPDSFANRSKDLARFSLELADNQINLIMDNPFKRTA